MYSVANVTTTNTFDSWRTTTNVLANAMSNFVITSGNTNTGDMGITGNLSSNTITLGNTTTNSLITGSTLYINMVSTNSVSVGNSTVNAVVNTSSLAISNSTANIIVKIPTASQISNGQYYLNANGQWSTSNTLNVGASISVGNSTVNAFINTTMISISNSTVNTELSASGLYIANTTANLSITVPTAVQIANNNYFLNANGQWGFILIPNTVSVGTVAVGASATLVDSWPVATYVSSEYMLNVNDNVNNNHATSKMLVMHSTNTVLSTEYGQIVSNSVIGTFNANIALGYVNVYFTPNSGFTSTTVKFARTII